MEVKSRNYLLGKENFCLRETEDPTCQGKVYRAKSQGEFKMGHNWDHQVVRLLARDIAQRNNTMSVLQVQGDELDPW